MVHRREKEIDPVRAFRAIYLDFEGFVDAPPALAGVLCEYRMNQVVLEPDLELAAKGKNLQVNTLDHLIEELVQQAREEDRCIVGFSQAEKVQVRAHAGIDLTPLYRDARLIAKRWVNRLYPTAEVEWRLKDLAEFIGWRAPSHLGDGVATKRLRDVLSGLAVKQDYGSLTPVQKAKWTKLLEYNRLDCLTMRDLVLRASAETHASGGA